MHNRFNRSNRAGTGSERFRCLIERRTAPARSVAHGFTALHWRAVCSKNKTCTSRLTWRIWVWTKTRHVCREGGDKNKRQRKQIFSLLRFDCGEFPRRTHSIWCFPTSTTTVGVSKISSRTWAYGKFINCSNRFFHDDSVVRRATFPQFLNLDGTITRRFV